MRDIVPEARSDAGWKEGQETGHKSRVGKRAETDLQTDLQADTETNQKKDVGNSRTNDNSWRRLLHPRLILLVAIVLPGVGQVLNRQPMRGLMMVFFMLVLAVVCYQLTTPEHSVLGRFAGGWFIYALSIMDAYQFARRRWELDRQVR